MKSIVQGIKNLFAPERATESGAIETKATQPSVPTLMSQVASMVPGARGPVSMDGRVKRRDVLALDGSPSMFVARSDGRSGYEVLKSALDAYLAALNQQPESVALSALWFGGVSREVMAWTRVNAQMNPSPLVLDEAIGGTDFVSALNGARELVDQVPESLRPTTVVHLYTDGEHNGSGDPVIAATAIKAAGVRLHCLGCAERESDVNMALLREMASAGPDGWPWAEFCGTPDALVRAFEGIANGLMRGTT